VRIALCPDRVVLVRFPRGLRREIAEKKILPCPPSGASEESGASGPAWRAAVDTLGSAVRDWKGGKAEATVILSNHFVRYVLVPWSDDLNSEQETLDFARHCFVTVYGDAAATWGIRLSNDGGGAPRVASAVEPGLLEAVTRAFDASPLRLRSVQPYLMAAYNQWRQRFDGKTAWFALAERGRLCLAQFHQNHWHSLRGLPVGDSLDEELPAIMERESYLTSLAQPDASVFVFSPEHGSTRLPVGEEQRFQPLSLPACPGFSPIGDHDYAMAMTG
jgi:hypothetical protein